MNERLLEGKSIACVSNLCKMNNWVTQRSSGLKNRLNFKIEENNGVRSDMVVSPNISVPLILNMDASILYILQATYISHPICKET